MKCGQPPTAIRFQVALGSEYLLTALKIETRPPCRRHARYLTGERMILYGYFFHVVTKITRPEACQ
jgi:hypothetical protein